MTRTRPLRLLQGAAVALLSATALAQDDAFDCHITHDGLQYDLTTLAGVHLVKRDWETPPSTMIESVRFSLCSDLEPLEDVSDRDQCPSGTRACLTKTNRKSDEDDRIMSVIQLATSSASNVQYSALSSPKGLSVSFRGPSYPPSADDDPTPQSFNLRLLCSPDSSEPSFYSYDGSEMWVEWSSPSGCGGAGDGSGDEPTPDGDMEKPKGSGKSVGSGVGYFFLLLFLALAAYFGLGAYYNYSTYGASGMDLIPHRDFWREVPYMLSDVIAHLCSAVRPRQSAGRGGYIAV
ncbi:uncharacterized protein FIBRA_07579 [Fibroporia radiculosa]|uniref:Autophagy-related protein 27 n=1 Tax=Fibroporia radiculosa TaxID=599839 RepID=J4H4P8_9APHY|nr:uncharacterized protein FIBRA_07579 [Fibroporia radiculosa]CCM05364.1 predicted protein [Fibroporia radiculosa]